MPTLLIVEVLLKKSFGVSDAGSIPRSVDFDGLGELVVLMMCGVVELRKALMIPVCLGALRPNSESLR
jgi:hypothetical protein